MPTRATPLTGGRAVKTASFVRVMPRRTRNVVKATLADGLGNGLGDGVGDDWHGGGQWGWPKGAGPGGFGSTTWMELTLVPGVGRAVIGMKIGFEIEPKSRALIGLRFCAPPLV